MSVQKRVIQNEQWNRWMKIFAKDMLETNQKMLFHVLEIVRELVGFMEIGMK